ncbi:MAG: nucleotidyl transferase AbiEii/AbiGii toxin family protein [Deltaproteobacteria bacterium]|nr:nucleotidyl transferase AbiEii/AbiGii toxin family protein [Deltaproteobacteria bacterium]
MSFIHDDPDFVQVLRLVSAETRIDPSLVEKDYWVTHCMWALHQTGLELWFKGGTSLSKGYGIIQRFSEDLDLMVQHGTAVGLPSVSNWSSVNKGPIAARRAFYAALPGVFCIPSVKVEIDEKTQDKHARGINLVGRYPGVLLDQLSPTMSPYVFFEIGRARVVPFADKPLSSFVHDWLQQRDQLGNYTDNRPRSVRCVHPLVTLIEKLDALSRRYAREKLEPDGFVRHYEDAAHIIRSLSSLPPVEQSPRALADEMLGAKNLAAIPIADEHALILDDGARRSAVKQALARIHGMFWGPRIPVDEACATIRAWVRGNLE